MRVQQRRTPPVASAALGARVRSRAEFGSRVVLGEKETFEVQKALGARKTQGSQALLGAKGLGHLSVVWLMLFAS